jgi:hypothetical protein
VLVVSRNSYSTRPQLHYATQIPKYLAPAHQREEDGALRAGQQHLDGRGIRQRGVTFAELGRHAGRVAPGDREAALDDEEQRFSGAVDRQSRLVGIEPDGERAEIARVESGQVVDAVTELADLEQRLLTTVVHPRPSTRQPLWPPTRSPSCVRSAASRSVAGRGVRTAASAAASTATSAPAAASRKNWLPVATMTKQHERRVERSDRADEQASTVAQQAGGDDQRVADVHAGNGGVWLYSELTRPRLRSTCRPETVSRMPTPASRGGAVG